MEKIRDCSTAEAAIHNELSGLDHEEAWVLFLTTANSIICSEMVSKGTLDATIIDNRTILRRALLNNAGQIILAHNHPSGDPTPSINDVKLTEKLKQACDIMGINLIDHIIVSTTSFYSFAAEESFGFNNNNTRHSCRR